MVRLLQTGAIVVVLIGRAPCEPARAAPPLEPRPAAIEPRRSPAATPAYTIHDIGMPPPATYPSSTPIGFNNSGQMFGVALRSAKGDRYSYFGDTVPLRRLHD